MAVLKNGSRRGGAKLPSAQLLGCLGSEQNPDLRYFAVKPVRVHVTGGIIRIFTQPAAKRPRVYVTGGEAGGFGFRRGVPSFL
ncbi:hypothetical protein RQN30_01605 [Arcanobacterium hippocoleae]